MDGRTARRSLARLIAHWAVFVAVVGALFCAAAAKPAWADGGESGDAPPRDEILVMHPAAAKVPAPPADFTRLHHAWTHVALPSTVRERGEAFLREADDFRARLAEDFGQPVLDHVL